jgi:hypothetical protein
VINLKLSEALACRRIASLFLSRKGVVRVVLARAAVEKDKLGHGYFEEGTKDSSLAN